MAKLGEKQAEILQYIYDMVKDRGYPPTVREIGAAVDLSSTSTVHGHLDRLERKGMINRDPTKPRAIEITEDGLDELGATRDRIPLLGTVTAGEPILAVQEATEFFPVPPDLQNDGDLFMLQIRGESMINAGILSGDKVVVRPQQYADNGDIVIAMTEENEATCKRFYREKDHFRLQPENDTFAPIILQEVTILGKVGSLYREHVY